MQAGESHVQQQQQQTGNPAKGRPASRKEQRRALVEAAQALADEEDWETLPSYEP